MDGDGTQEMTSREGGDGVTRGGEGVTRGGGESVTRGGGGDDGVSHPLTLTHEQEMALHQIIESNHMRQLRSTSPLPISGAHCFGASAPPSHSGEKRHGGTT